MSIEYQGGNRLNAIATCDQPGCPNALGTDHLVRDVEPGEQVQWEVVPHTGWSTKGDKHYCAEHPA